MVTKQVKSKPPRRVECSNWRASNEKEQADRNEEINKRVTRVAFRWDDSQANMTEQEEGSVVKRNGK